MKAPLFLISVWCFFALCAQAQPLTDSQKAELKKAYKYRTDIDKNVLKETRQWKHGVGVLHSDWIEGQNGESIDLQGNTTAAPTTQRPPVSKADSLRLDSIDFISNKWMQLYHEYYEAGMFDKAHFCLQYYHNHEMPFLRSRRSMPNYRVIAYDIDCHTALQEFDIASDIILGKLKEWQPMGLKFSPRDKGFLPDTAQYALTPEDTTHLVQMADAINASYAGYIKALMDKQAHRKKASVGEVLLTGLAAIGVVGLVGVTFILDIVSSDDFQLTGGLFRLLSGITDGGGNVSKRPEVWPASVKAHPTRFRTDAPKDLYEDIRKTRYTFAQQEPKVSTSHSEKNITSYFQQRDSTLTAILDSIGNPFLPTTPKAETEYAFHFGDHNTLACYRRFILQKVDASKVEYHSVYLHPQRYTLFRTDEKLDFEGNTLVFAVAPLMSAGEYERGFSFKIPPTLNIGDTLPTGTLVQIPKIIGGAPTPIPANRAATPDQKNTIHFHDFRVVGKESVTTNAGTFQCYRIEGRMSGFIHDAPPLGNTPYTLWVSPQIGIVKISTTYYNMLLLLHSLKGC